MTGTEPSPAARIAGIIRSSLSRIEENAALAYSGGLDSSVILAASGYSLHAYTVGMEGSKDFHNAHLASELLKFPIRTFTISETDVIGYRKILTDIDPGITRLELGYEIVLAAVLDNVPERQVVTGQGADELFYGYRRFIDDPALTNEAHLAKLNEITLPREKKLSEYYGKTLLTPFLDSEVVSSAQSLDRSNHITGENNKAVLREAASLLGLPPEIYRIPKKAAQYGSGVAKILSKIK